MRLRNFQSTTNRRLAHILASSSLLLASQYTAKAITIQIDYSYDTSGFFSVGSTQRSVLETAATYVGSLILDDLEAIEPDAAYLSGPGNQWEVDFTDPSNASNTLFDDFLTVPADTIIVFAGGYNFSGATLAKAGFGGASTIGSAAFNTTVATRGETGPAADEFSTWGGFLSADTDTLWDYSLDGSTMGTSETDFYSVMLRELGHVVGLGTAPSWSNRISAGNFTGTEASALYGGAIPTTGGDHFANTVFGDIFGTTTSQKVSLASNIASNETRYFTDIDVAALDDIGWDVVSAPVPEPSAVTLLLACAGFVCTRRKRA